jgi:hypothetical protein
VDDVGDPTIPYDVKERPPVRDHHSVVELKALEKRARSCTLEGSVAQAGGRE